MNRFLILIFPVFLGHPLAAQYVYTIKADSVKITNSCDTAELIIENHTQHVPGFLYNKGGGRTEFRRGIIALNDSLYLIGADTLNINKGVTATNGLSKSGGSIVLGNEVGGISSKLTSDREIPLGGYNVGFSGPGKIGIGTTSPVYNLDIRGTYGVTTRNGYPLTFEGGLPAVFNAVHGAGDFGFCISRAYNDVGAANLSFYKTRNSNPAIRTAAVPNDMIGRLLFQTVTSDNNTIDIANVIRSVVDSISSTKVDGRIEFCNWNKINGHITRMTIAASGNVGIGSNTAPTAALQIKAGTTAPGTAPLKLTAGTILSTPENGAIEFDGTDLYLTENSTRYKLSKILTGQLTTSFGGPSLSAYNSVTTTLSVSGAQPGDVVTVSANSGAVNPPSIIISAYITSANTVTLQAYNAGNSAVTIASDTYKVRVIK